WQLVAASGSVQARRRGPAACFALGQGESLGATVLARGLIAGYTAETAIDAPGRYRFGTLVEGGTAKLQIFAAGGRKLDQFANAGAPGPLFTGWLELRAAPVTVSVLITRAGAGPVRLRTLWQQEGVGELGFAADAIP